MRASQLHANVDCFGCLGDKEHLVRARCADAMAGIEGAIRTAWLPLHYGIEMVDAVEDICGREVSQHLARKAIDRSMQGTLLGPILGGLVRLGLGPEHALKRAPATWGLVFKHCGEVTCTTASTHATLRLHGTPKLMRSVPYLHSVGAAFEGIVTALGGENTEVTLHDDTPGIFYEIRWEDA